MRASAQTLAGRFSQFSHFANTFAGTMSDVVASLHDVGHWERVSSDVGGNARVVSMVKVAPELQRVY